MFQIKHRSLALALMLAATAVAGATDVARFVNLGFSPDAGVFMFGQHGVMTERSGAYAEIYTVDVPGNRFVSGGVYSREAAMELSAGQDGIGALFALVPDAAAHIRRFAIDHLRQGRLIYLRVNGEQPRPMIDFRDFETGTRYRITTVQDARGAGESGSAAFYLGLTIDYANGRSVQHRVGRPGYYREGVNRYRVHQVILAPDDRSLVMVVERITELDDGRRVRYMVETVQP